MAGYFIPPPNRAFRQHPLAGTGYHWLYQRKCFPKMAALTGLWSPTRAESQSPLSSGEQTHGGDDISLVPSSCSLQVERSWRETLCGLSRGLLYGWIHTSRYVRGFRASYRVSFEKMNTEYMQGETILGQILSFLLFSSLFFSLPTYIFTVFRISEHIRR